MDFCDKVGEDIKSLEEDIIGGLDGGSTSSQRCFILNFISNRRNDLDCE